MRERALLCVTKETTVKNRSREKGGSLEKSFQKTQTLNYMAKTFRVSRGRTPLSLLFVGRTTALYMLAVRTVCTSLCLGGRLEWEEEEEEATRRRLYR